MVNSDTTEQHPPLHWFPEFPAPDLKAGAPARAASNACKRKEKSASSKLVGTDVHADGKCVARQTSMLPFAKGRRRSPYSPSSILIGWSSMTGKKVRTQQSLHWMLPANEGLSTYNVACAQTDFGLKEQHELALFQRLSHVCEALSR